MKKLFLIVLLCAAGVMSAQEICNNGIDDDGDMMIDLNDDDCICTATGTAPSSLIPNPSFESQSCCPSSYSMLYCADTWIQASDATSDYLHTCDFTSNAPLPIPDGSGCAGFICSNFDWGTYTEPYNEYMGACLTTPMLAGTQYTMQFNIAFQYLSPYGASTLPGTVPTCPIDITIFGTPNCGDIPWTGYACPIGVGGFVELGHITYNPTYYSWSVQTITFTPTFDVYAIALGGPCNLPLSCGYEIDMYAGQICPYFYMDNLTLNQSVMFNPVTITTTGTLCTSDLVMTANAGGPGTYQWYFGGVAIPGATGVTYNASTGGYGAGAYQVMFTDVNGCGIAEYIADITTIPATSSPDESICQGESVTISASGGTSYIWDQGLGAGQSHTVTPSATTTYNVVVSNAAGCTGTESVTITVNSNPTPSITGILTFCTGTSTTLDAGGGYTIYDWNPSGATQTINVTSGGTYTVIVTNAFGCTGTSSVVVNESTNLAPVISGNLAICPGQSTTLDAGAGYATYEWSTIEFTQTITVNTLGLYEVTVSDATGCTGTDNVTVIQATIPTASAGNDQTICDGGSAIISASGGVSYDWDNGLGVGQSHTVSPLATTTYTVTVTSAAGCTGTDDMTVTVEPNPVITILPANPVTCQGVDVMITASGALTYVWSPSAGLSSATGSVVYASPESPTTYTVTGTTAAGCISTGTVTVDVTEVIISASMDLYICSGASTDLYVSVIGGTPPYSYTWNGMPGPETITISPAANTTIAVIATDAAGCISNTDNVNITVTKPLQFSIAVNETDVCPGESVVITASWSEGMPPYIFTDENGSPVSFPYTVFPAEASSYVFNITDACGTELQDNVSVNTYPVPVISMSADTLEGCQPFTVHFNESNNYASYLWEFGNDPDNLSHNHNPVHTFEYPGVYDISLTVTSQYGCISSQTVNDLIHVYPTPDANFTPDPDVVSILKPEITFINHTVDGYFYYWSFGDGDSSWYVNPTHRFRDLGEYNVVLIAESEYGCRDTVFYNILVKDEFTFYAPSAFSPNADGTNDLFRVYGHGIDLNSFKMIIYDRWGEPIFETTIMEEPWNGRMAGTNEVVKSGSYPWICIFKDFKGIEHEETGAVTVIR